MDSVWIFAGGAFTGRFLGIIPSVVITGVLLYTVNPNFYSFQNCSSGYKMMIEFIKNITH
jgi:hypothetical protein